MVEPPTLFEDAMAWLRQHYNDRAFYIERDIVWTIQGRIASIINAHSLPYDIRHNYRVITTPRVEADLVILDSAGSIVVAVEFKYEPSHQRPEYPASKFPVAFWFDQRGGILKDVERVRQFVELGAVRVAYSVFIDEGRHYRSKQKYAAPVGTEWRDWEPDEPSHHRVSVLWGKFVANSGQPTRLLLA